MPTLDVEQSQVLVDYPDDANYTWHHRLLLVSLGGSVWICVTPDLAVQRIDLSNHRVVVLQRNAAFPAARVGDTYGFDAGDVTPAVLADLLRQARDLAAIHGAPAPGPVASAEVWRISDTSHASFAEEVPAAVLLNPDLFIARDDFALVRIDASWTTAKKERPETEGKDRFSRGFHSGPGRDRRIMADERDPDGRRFLGLAAILPLLLEVQWPQWPIAGPRSVREFLLAVRAAGHTALLEYHNEWVRTSGASEKAAFTREHRFILEVVRLMLQFDQLDGSSLASCELLLRRLYQIELAVRKSPKSPDFDGLEFLLETAVDASGAAVLPSIAKWLGETQHKEAFTLKQMRLWTEERAALDKKKQNNNKNDKNDK